MNTISETIGVKEYHDLIQKHPLKLSSTLEELGPLLRLQLLFTMCNQPALQVAKNYFNWGCEVLRNLAFVEDLSLLDDIDLGHNGRELYSKLPIVARKEKSTW